MGALAQSPSGVARCLCLEAGWDFRFLVEVDADDAVGTVGMMCGHCQVTF